MKKSSTIKYKLDGIDIWGNSSLKDKDIEKKLKIKIGNFYSVSEINKIIRKAELYLKTDPSFSGVMMPRYKQEQLTCLTIDFINSKNSKILKKINPKPKKSIKLPEEVNATYKEYEQEMQKCFSNPKRSVRYQKGRSFSEDSKLRNIQKKFISLNKKYSDLLIEAAKYDRLVPKRALSTYILGWHHNKRSIIDVLLYNLYDSNYVVQNNAALALGQALEESFKENKFKVPIEPIIDLLKMPSGLSRNKAIALIFQFVQAGKNIEIIKKEAGSIIKKMSKSKQLNHQSWAKEIMKKI